MMWLHSDCNYPGSFTRGALLEGGGIGLMYNMVPLCACNAVEATETGRPEKSPGRGAVYGH